MKKQKVKFRHLLGLLMFSSLIILTGCKHQLSVRNIDTYKYLKSSPLKKNLSVGLVTQADDVYCDIISRGIGDSLSKYSTDVLIFNSLSSSDKVDVIADVSISPEYKGSGWNFWINFPGFIAFAPAWNGYVYKVNYNVNVKLLEPANLTEIDSFDLPINLDIRHADINRTWTEISWLEFGVIAFVGGLFFMQYDNSVSPILAEDLKLPIGNYIAQMIVDRINESKKFTQIIKFKDDNQQLAFVYQR